MSFVNNAVGLLAKTSEKQKQADMNKPEIDDPVQVDPSFLKNIRIGSQLFHYRNRGNADRSFAHSPSAEYTLYSVIDIIAENEVVMVKAFDETEQKKNYSHSELLSGDWWRRSATH
jgi:hypothetical protein